MDWALLLRPRYDAGERDPSREEEEKSPSLQIPEITSRLTLFDVRMILSL